MSEGGTFKVGDKVTILRGKLMMNDRYDSSWCGSVLEVLAFSWPYCVVSERITKFGTKPKENRIALDMREYELGILDQAYIDALTLARQVPHD